MGKLIDEKTTAELKAKFGAEFRGTVDVKVFTSDIITDPGNPQVLELNEFARQFVKELHDIEPRIIPQALDFNSKEAQELKLKTSPSILIGYDMGYRIIYNGAPLGHEASVFIETLSRASSGESLLSPASKETLSKLDKEVKLQVFTTPDCPHCPRSVMLANQIAVQTRGRVTAECVESMENQALAKLFNVSSVPQQVVNGDMASITVGTQPEKKMVAQVLKYSAPAVFEEMNKEETALRQQKEKLSDNPEGAVFLTDSNFDEALKRYGNLVVDFWAEWCAPCKALGPFIEQLAAENKGKVVFGKLNVDENPGVSTRFGISSIPAVYFFKKGEKAGETIGLQGKGELQVKINGIYNL